MTSPIVPLDPATASDTMITDVYALRHGCHVEVAPDDPDQSLPEWLSLIRMPPAHVRRWHWTTDGGYACLTRIDDAATAKAEIVVAGPYRRHGMGSALAEVLRARAADLGCHTLIGQHAGAAGAAFAETLGAHPGNRQIRSVLSMHAFVPMPTAVSGYALRSWERAPEDLLASYARARNAINDAPHTPGQAEEDWTPQMVRDFEATVARRGRQTRVTVAVDDHGDVAAFTELRLSPGFGATAMTEDTAVDAAHRGRGLAAWIKTASLRRLHYERPDVQVVVTSNDSTNVAMLRTNQRLGFQPVAIWTDAVLKVRRGTTEPP